MTEPVRVLVEVTDTLSIDFTTGIQRVVREVIGGLQGPAGDGLEILPVVATSNRGTFRLASPEERERLAVHPAGGRAGRRANDFGPLSPLVRRVGDLQVTTRTRAALVERRRRRAETADRRPELELGPLVPGSVFLDVEGSWYDPTPRADLLPAMRAAGVHTVPLVHDVMPVRFPQWFTARHVSVFRSWLRAHLEHSELFLANSERTAADLRAAAADEGVTGELDVRVVPLGADYPVATPITVELPTGIGRFLLAVGTLEPRKNQQVVLDAFDRLRATHDDLGLVLVGKEGWMVEQLVARIRAHPESGRRLVWLAGVHDAELTWLYEHAFLTVAPSIYEGLGVPVMEALARGCPTISSTGGALPEAGAGVSELFDPSSTDELTRLVAAHLDDAHHHDLQRRAAAAYVVPTWRRTAEAVAAALLGLGGAGGSASEEGGTAPTNVDPGP